jgi:hypothetical protein
MECMPVTKEFEGYARYVFYSQASRTAWSFAISQFSCYDGE